MYSHFSTNKFEAIQNELSNSDLELEPEIQQEEVKLVTFSYPFLGESTLSVQLVGDFNNWDTNNAINMPLEKDWMFMTKLWLPTDKAYQYRFIINGSRWENTANASQYVSTPFGSENMILAV